MTIYPRDIQSLINTGAAPLDAGPYPHICPNCGGNKIVGAFQLQHGPYQSPGEKSKWIDGDKPGWYSVVSHYEYCPVCRGGQVPYDVIMQGEAQRPGAR